MNNILGWLVIIIGGGFSLITCLYMVVSLLAMIFYKIYRKIRFHASLYDWYGGMNMDILVIIMGVIAVAFGIAGFVNEHGGLKKDKSPTDKTEQ